MPIVSVSTTQPRLVARGRVSALLAETLEDGDPADSVRYFEPSVKEQQPSDRKTQKQFTEIVRSHLKNSCH